MKALGLQIDSSKFSSLDIDRMYAIHASIEKASKARQTAKGKLNGRR